MSEFTRQVLDHGFVRLRNLAGPTRRHFVENAHTFSSDRHMDTMCSVNDLRPFDADDVDPAQAARMSFAQMDSERTYKQDMGLNHYLLRNEHTSPFEMIGVWLEVKVPIMIDRQMVRHRTWSRNEESARYTVLPREWYIPEIVGGKAADKKQGQEDNLPPEVQESFKQALQESCEESYEKYEFYLSQGVAPEHSRMFLHLNHYVHWIGQVDLANLFKFLRLRVHDHAQIEAQKYGHAIIDLVRPHLPGLMGLFDELVRK
jgi:thymidylate synthase (FAD)